MILTLDQYCGLYQGSEYIVAMHPVSEYCIVGGRDIVKLSRYTRGNIFAHRS